MVGDVFQILEGTFSGGDSFPKASEVRQFFGTRAGMAAAGAASVLVGTVAGLAWLGRQKSTTHWQDRVSSSDIASAPIKYR